jgi:ABC-type Fe3+-hydroxamate transport system substrate-binding protein
MAMTRSISVIAAIAAFTLTIACHNNEQSASTSSSSSATSVTQATMTPEQLGELGAAIKKSPNDAQRLLADHGLTEETFEQQVRKVAEDPAASKRYADAYKKAGA